MEPRDILSRIREDVGALLKQGREFVHIPALLEYLNALERDAPAISKAVELQHQSVLAQHRSEHEANLEMFRSVLETGKTAITTAILVSGGGTAAFLAFVGNIYAKNPAVPLASALVGTLIFFSCGVLSGAVASGTRYLSQMCYGYRWRRSAIGFHICTVILVLVSYALFALGILAAYHGFIR